MHACRLKIINKGQAAVSHHSKQTLKIPRTIKYYYIPFSKHYYYYYAFFSFSYRRIVCILCMPNAEQNMYRSDWKIDPVFLCAAESKSGISFGVFVSEWKWQDIFLLNFYSKKLSWIKIHPLWTKNKFNFRAEIIELPFIRDSTTKSISIQQ